MSEISTVDGLGINPFQSHQLKRRYQKHVQTIVCIANKKPNIKQISSQQEKISKILKRSKEISKDFKENQFRIKREEENKRLMRSISLIHSREKLKTQESEGKLSFKTPKTKENAIKKYEIERENLILANNLIKNSCDVSKYKKKIQKQIGEYLKIKNHIQKLKPITGRKQKKFAHQQCKEELDWKKPRLKTFEAQTKTIQINDPANSQKKITLQNL